jgi:hypothetical protein
LTLPLPFVIVTSGFEPQRSGACPAAVTFSTVRGYSRIVWSAVGFQQSVHRLRSDFQQAARAFCTTFQQSEEPCLKNCPRRMNRRR